MTMITTAAPVARAPVPPRGAQWLTAVLVTLAVWRGRRQDRRTLLALDDRLLRDIGMSRSDALREGAKPSWRR